MTDRAAARLAWGVFGFVSLLFAAGAVSYLWEGPSGDPSGVFLSVEMFAFSVVGVLVASRQPRNSIGWILLAIGLVWQSNVLTEMTWLVRPVLGRALTQALWVPGIGLIGTFLILLFPDGRLPSPRWRHVARLSGVALAVSSLAITFSPGPIEDDLLPRATNPLGIEALRPVLGAAYFFIALIPLCIVACAWGLIRRFRRSHGQERLQLKWLATGAGTTATLYLMAMVPSVTLDLPWDGSGPTWLTFLQNTALYSFSLIPLAIGMAILKYRLYDIDLIINRTLVYAALSATLTAAYLGAVTVLQGLFSPVAGESELAVAGSTLAVAALFRPARARIQAFIDRRFYRRKYDAAQTIERFSTRLRDQVDLDALSAELTTLINDAMQPTHVSLWLRKPHHQAAHGQPGQLIREAPPGHDGLVAG